MRLLTITLLFISSLAFGQRVISLEGLAKKTEKSDGEISISDHTIDGKSITKSGYTLVFTGKGTRGLVFKNFHGTSGKDPVKIIFKDAIINMASNSVAVKMSANDWYVDLVCENCQINGLPGGGASQVIYWEGEKHKGARVIGFTIDQGRPADMLKTVGGSAIQFAGSYSASCNVTNWAGYEYIDLINNTVRRANDEIYYIGHNNVTDGYGPVRTGVITINGLDGDGSGRECVQITNADTVRGKNIKCRNGSQERDNLHWSSLSLNDKNNYVWFEDSFFEGVAQPVYSGALNHSGSTTFKNCTFIQRKDYTAPSALYLKGNANYKYILANCTIVANQYAITSDSGPVYLVGTTNAISSPTVLRPMKGTLSYIPETTTSTHQEPVQVVETVTWEGVKTVKYYLNGIEFKM